MRIQEREYKNYGKEVKADKLDCEAIGLAMFVQGVMLLGQSGYEQ